MRTKYSPVVATAFAEKVKGDAAKKQPIAPGHVRFERHEYSYGQQGQVTLVGYKLIDVPERDALNWVCYGCSSVTWPDGEMESFDMRVTPAEHRPHLGYGEITYTDGRKATGTLSRLPNTFVEYYGARFITDEERSTFRMIHDTWNVMAS